jgi:glycosyltransferase involved in cell wall biosynthesis
MGPDHVETNLRSSGVTRRRDEAAHVRVLLTGPDLSKPRGGIQTFVESILTAFESVNEVDAEFFPVTLGLYRDESWFRKASRNLAAIAPFRRRIHNCDIVHLNSSFDSRSVARDSIYLALALLGRRRIVLMFHGGDPARVVWFRWPVARELVSALLARCAVILVLSKFQASNLQRACPTLRRIEQIPNFIDVGPAVHRTQTDGGEARFLYLGRLHIDKGLRLIVQAARDLLETRRRFLITICGSGPEEAWIRDQIADSELGRHVRFAGVVRGGGKADMLRNSDVLLLPSSHPEGFPFAVLEAFSAGMPVIATSIGALAEVVSHGETGLIIPPHSSAALAAAMRQFIDDDGLRRRMGARARELVERSYSHDEMRRVFARVYYAAART